MEEELLKKRTVYIYGIAEYSSRIRKYLRGVDYKAFLATPKTSDAVSFSFMMFADVLGTFVDDFTFDDYPNFPHILTGLKSFDISEVADPEFLWEFLKDDEYPIWPYFKLFEKMYQLEIVEQTPKVLQKKAKLFPNQHPHNSGQSNSNHKLGLDTNYKYPTKSNTSIWTVKKK